MGYTNETLKQRAEETVKILKLGCYETDDAIHDFSSALNLAVCGTLYYPQEQKLNRKQTEIHKTVYQVTGETTFAAAKRLEDPVCLNFASAKNPGGGFLRGTQAQEEVLSRCSGLYFCIEPHKEYYANNRSLKSSLYTDDMLYSPRVPVIRDDEERLCSPWTTSVITAPAVNQNGLPEEEFKKIKEIMLRRIEKVLTIASNNGHVNVVLGAWGCGVFRNSPTDMANWFKQVIQENFRASFKTVVFAIYDVAPDQPALTSFKSVFQDLVSGEDSHGT